VLLAPWTAKGRRVVPVVAWLAAFAGGTASAHGPLHEQIEALGTRIEQDPSDAMLYLRRGELLGLHGECDAALADFDSAAFLAPSLAAVELARGKALAEDGRLVPARLALDRFMARSPGHAEAHALRARVLLKLGDPRGAVEDYERAIAGWERPEPEYYLERARVLANLGDLGRAVRGLDEGIAKLGPVVSLELPAIDIELAAGRYERALARVDRIAARFPRRAPWLARRGEILERAGRLPEARQAYLEALETSRLARPTGATLELRARVARALARLGSAGVESEVEP
jgi:tetratricopeptide (TPR) repeat protein